ncbi:MAG: SAM-dependent methyltransferase, partial [Candidatus Tectomicrobia bacterium]|nr:SAM-dependent methyltransferase [Candidatus Tectomicrobia bacterium]
KCLKGEFPPVYDRTHYGIVEVGRPPSSFREEVDRFMPEFRNRLCWFAPAEWMRNSEPFGGCVLAQEFLDALPVHRVVYNGQDWGEIYVDYREGSFTEVVGPLSSPDLWEYCRLAPVQGPMATGTALEINLAAARWLQELSDRLQQGYILILDYGIWGSPLLADTLSCHFRQTAHHNPYIWLGEQDMTTHVDFHSLLLTAKKLGFAAQGLVSQRKFLFNLGIVERAMRRYDSRDPSVGLPERLALKTLTLPGGMGDRFWVSLLERSMGGYPRFAGVALRGFESPA